MSTVRAARPDVWNTETAACQLGRHYRIELGQRTTGAQGLQADQEHAAALPLLPRDAVSAHPVPMLTLTLSPYPQPVMASRVIRLQTSSKSHALTGPGNPLEKGRALGVSAKRQQGCRACRACRACSVRRLMMLHAAYVMRCAWVQRWQKVANCAAVTWYRQPTHFLMTIPCRVTGL